MKALSIHGLTKTYRNGVQALKGIDLDVDEGEFFALLGPNGAGKTTAIGIITSLVNKSGGTVEVFGHDIDRELDRALGVLLPLLPASQAADAAAQLTGAARNHAYRRAQQLKAGGESG